MRKSSVLILSLFTLSFIISCQNQMVEPEGESTEQVVESAPTLPKVPEKMSLFGEQIELDNFDIRERLDKEIIVNTYFHSSTIQILKKANRYFPLIEKILEEEGVPNDMKYLCVIESALNQATSPSGAKGFWQFMPAAGKENGLLINKEVDERFHVGKSTRAACDYLKTAKRNFNDWILASASYNCGVGGLKKVMKAQEAKSFFDLYMNRETTRYVFRIMALKLLMENPTDYGFDPEKMELYEAVETRQIEVDKSIPDLAKWANDNGSNLRMLKVLNPWLISTKLTVSERTFTIELPAK
ncbi:MAG: lytic transglycosylase domain-containing protein [Crocinitomicaceae bacterium]|nr:lytic transglycosylase domain-containing protein [Crocinitomicaceae bacterium]